MTSLSQNNLKLFAVIFVPKILFGPLPVHFYPQGEPLVSRKASEK